MRLQILCTHKFAHLAHLRAGRSSERVRHGCGTKTAAQQQAANLRGQFRIQRTLQYNFVDPELGDPASLDIYYCMEGDLPLTLPGIDVTIPMDQPYQGFTIN